MLCQRGTKVYQHLNVKSTNVGQTKCVNRATKQDEWNQIGKVKL